MKLYAYGDQKQLVILVEDSIIDTCNYLSNFHVKVIAFASHLKLNQIYYRSGIFLVEF